MSPPERLRRKPSLASEDDEKQAFEASLAIERYADRTHPRDLAIQLDPANGGPVVSLPPPAVEALARVLEQIAEGNDVLITPVHAEISTQEAADLLRVSRPHLVHLLERGELPYRHVGKHRRVKLRDVLSYRQQQATERREAFDAIAVMTGRRP